MRGGDYWLTPLASCGVMSIQDGLAGRTNPGGRSGKTFLPISSFSRIGRIVIATSSSSAASFSRYPKLSGTTSIKCKAA